MDIKKKIGHAVTKTVSAVANSLSQTQTDRQSGGGEVAGDVSALFRRAAAEGAVLLENNGVLPFKKGEKIALFGITSYQTHFVGYGSGGDVNKPYAVSIAQGIENCEELEYDSEIADIYEKWNEKNPINHGFWAHWPFYYPEMPIDRETVSSAMRRNCRAVVTIGRSAGEDRDNKREKGSYYLADDEADMLDKVTAEFSDVTVLLNIGGIMDLSWLRKYGGRIGAVLIIWQGGMESGNAAADLLCGKVNPCGRLTDTVANCLEDYPSDGNFGGRDENIYKEDIYVGYRYFETFAKNKAVYPFGYGMSYTDFDIKKTKAERQENGFKFSFKVTNTGAAAGKQVVQLYVSKPLGVIGNPARELCAFKKTGVIAPGESETVELCVCGSQLASFDEYGEEGLGHAYVILGGEYEFFAGENVRGAKSVFKYKKEKTEVCNVCSWICPPKKSFDTIRAKKLGDNTVIGNRTVYAGSACYAERNCAEIKPTGDRGLKLADVKSGKCTMEEFVAQLDTDELEAISRGDYTMNSPLGTKGNAGVLGGVTESLRQKGVDCLTATDGPSGIRLSAQCSLLPSGTLLASTFDEELMTDVYAAAAREMKEKGSDILLAPGMNIHRHPLCGRNFEYYSEDPYLAGKMAGAAVKGIQSCGGSACPKHFACNNQELRRNMNDSVVSERALREIYLRGFEICVKEASPKFIMTSYNKINSVYSHYNEDLCTRVLRNEWGFKGCVMTDWWMKSARSPENKKIRDQAYRVRAQVDVLMPGGSRAGKREPDGTLLETLGKKNGITLGELQRTAVNVLNAVLAIKYL